MDASHTEKKRKKKNINNTVTTFYCLKGASPLVAQHKRNEQPCTWFRSPQPIQKRIHRWTKTKMSNNDRLPTSGEDYLRMVK